jgi:hypothetical protein
VADGCLTYLLGVTVGFLAGAFVVYMAIVVIYW